MPESSPPSNVTALAIVPRQAASHGAYDAATAAAILEGLADGIPLRMACDAYGIKARVFYQWLAADAGLAAAYAIATAEHERARVDQADQLAAEALRIADSGEGDTYQDARGVVRVDYEAVARSKLRVDTRLALAAKLAPSRYGSKPDTGGDGKLTVDVRDPTGGPHAARVAEKGDPPLSAPDPVSPSI
ncbi:MAG: hypothetical protein KAX84_01650 [Burkholderiales bacterium]|nr:hypothetical protein [Burkholderiales bacterium]